MDWLTQVASTKPKYTDIVMMENANYVAESITRLKAKNVYNDYLDQIVN